MATYDNVKEMKKKAAKGSKKGSIPLDAFSRQRSPSTIVFFSDVYESAY